MADPITIGTSGTKWLKDANTIGVAYSEIYSSNGTATPYTVPVGKVMTILSCGMSAASDWQNVEGKILGNGSPICSVVAVAGDGTNNAFSYSLIKKFTAGQTIQFWRSNCGARSKLGMSFSGVETNA